MESISAENLARELEAMAEWPDLRPALGSVGVPLVARVGEPDLACPVEKSRELAACVPGASVEVVPGAGHALLEEDLPGTVASVRRALELR